MMRLGRGGCWLLALGLGLASRLDGAEPGTRPLLTRWAPLVSSQNALPEYPRPQMVRREWLNLNGLWQADLTPPPRAVPAGVTLPEKVLVPYPTEAILSGLRKHAERLWYRRTFVVPEHWQGNRVLLHFGAVDWEATVYVNGHELGTHRGGYDPFSFDITEALHPQGEQELLVRVFDPTDAGEQPRGKQVLQPTRTRYTASTGIWQTVWLEPVPPQRIERLTLVPDVGHDCLRLTVHGVGNDPEQTVQAVVRDGQTPVAEVFGGVGAEILVPIPPEHRKLWSPEKPFLYDVEVTLRQGDRPLDHVSSYFGLRKIEVAPDGQGVLRLQLNGRALFQMGVLDQGFWPDGLYTAPTDEALRYDIEVARQLGFNLIRKHVKVEPERWYYWCDKLGMLVWQDMPSGGNATPEAQRQFETELRGWIAARSNHPSIVLWVLFNEGWGQHDSPRYVELVKSWDPSRLVTAASGWTDAGLGDLHDLHQYPGPVAPPLEPARAGVLGEFGGLGLPVPGHLWGEVHWGYRTMNDGEQLLERYVGLLHDVWALQQTQGLSAAVYTQLTDVETECNGLVTYDRAILKLPPQAVTAANRGDVAKLSGSPPAGKAQRSL